MRPEGGVNYTDLLRRKKRAPKHKSDELRVMSDRTIDSSLRSG
jgi:hypothetical protein